MDGQQISPNVADKAAAQLPVDVSPDTPEQELNFIGPDIPFEYSSSTVRDQPLLDSTFPN